MLYFVSPSLSLVRCGQLLCYADKIIANIMLMEDNILMDVIIVMLTEDKINAVTLMRVQLKTLPHVTISSMMPVVSIIDDEIRRLQRYRRSSTFNL